MNTCRWSALTNRVEGRCNPVLSPQCDLVNFYDPHIRVLVDPVNTYRFFEMMAKIEECYPWSGNGLYTLEVVDYLLKSGTLATLQCHKGLTSHLPTSAFVDAYQKT